MIGQFVQIAFESAKLQHPFCVALLFMPRPRLPAVPVAHAMVGNAQGFLNVALIRAFAISTLHVFDCC